MRKLFFFSVFILMAFFILSSFNRERAENRTENSSEEIFFNTKTDTINWKLLSMIKFIKKTDINYGEVMFPVASPLLKEKNKKKIAISGFIIPIDSENYALSKNVFAACFFCGQAGPETIMGIKFKGNAPKLKTDQYVTLEGNFRINENDPDDWIYHIEDAVIVKGK